MAWQNSTMERNGVGPGGDSQNGGQPAGTEYTLQGVMRFLQSEWLRHERDRNAWDIEEAEMRSRIGRLEGDKRTAARLQSGLQKHVKMLENALKAEREKNKKLQKGEDVPSKADAGDAADSVQSLTSHSQDSKLEKDVKHAENRQDTERDKSKHFLNKCVQEATYHVIPTAMAQQALSDEEQLLPNHYAEHTNQPHGEEHFVQRQKQLNHVQHSVSNHQPPTNRDYQPQHSEQAPPMSRSTESSSSQSDLANSMDTRNRQQYFPSDEQVEKLSFSFDSHGQQIPSREEEPGTRLTEEEATTTEGWNFDVDEEPPPEHPTEYVPPQRPDTDAFPSAHDLPLKSPPRGPQARRKSSLSKRRQSDDSHELRELSIGQTNSGPRGEAAQFKVRFALRGHLDVVRSVIFTGGGTPAEPEICTTGDDSTIKRWTIPASYGYNQSASTKDLDINSYFTHRGHTGSVMCLAAAPASRDFLNGGRALGDGWVFSGGQDATVRVWERGRVDPKATLDGHSDAVWTVCVLPGSANSILGDSSNRHGPSPDKMLLASGAADGTIMIWAVSAPPHLTSPAAGSRRGAGGSRRSNSISSGSNFPSSPQPSTATNIPFHHSLVHRIERIKYPSPTCITPLSPNGDNFVVSYNDASVLIYDTRTAEEIVGMASQETYNDTPATGVNAVAATIASLEGSDRGRLRDEDATHNPTGSSSGIEGMVLSGHEDRYIRFFDANSGQCTYNMLAHPSAISALSLSPDGRELVSAGHDASLRFWSLEKRSCTQEITSHRSMRGEGVCTVVWSADGRWVVSGGGDGTVKVWARS